MHRKHEMRIAVFVPTLSDRDAVGRDAVAMVRALRTAGYDTCVACQESVAREFRAVHYQEALAKLGSDDLLIYHHCTFTPEAQRVLTLSPCKRVLRYHNVTPPEYMEGVNPACGRVSAAGREQTVELIESGFDEFWPTSEFNQAELNAGGAPADRCKVLPPFHYVESLLTQPLDSQLNTALSDGKLNLLNVGRLVPNKNHLFLLRSFARFRAMNDRDCRLIVVGKADPSLADWPRRMDELITELELGDCVQVVGCVDDKALSTYYRSAHAYISTSLHEGFCIPLIEAMAFGVPVVALNRAAVGETIANAGVLIADQDIEELARGISEVTRSSKIQESLIQNGRRRYRERFSEDVIESRLEAVVDELQGEEFAEKPLQSELSLDSASDAAAAYIDTIPRYRDGYQGRGILICAGGITYNTCAWVLINRLRESGCQLPIQVWYRGDHERDDSWISLVERLDVECVDASERGSSAKGHDATGWSLKPFALLRSTFREALLLDADIVPVQDPSSLFSTREFRDNGAIFWPDIGRTARESPAWRAFGVHFRDEPEQESGQVLVDKQRCWPALNLCNWYNQHADFFYQYVYGDKDTFRFAWHRLGETFGMPTKPPRRLSHALVQYDFDGKPLFQHRCLDKWSLAGNRCIAEFLDERRCLELVRELRGKWRPRLTANDGKDAGIEERVVGIPLNYSRAGSARWPVTLERGGLVRGGRNGPAFWWGEADQLVLADASGDVVCRLDATGEVQWQGREQASRCHFVRLVRAS